MIGNWAFCPALAGTLIARVMFHADSTRADSLLEKIYG
jgi:hypothetical protein